MLTAVGDNRPIGSLYRRRLSALVDRIWSSDFAPSVLLNQFCVLNRSRGAAFGLSWPRSGC
jgi:hypothetical protein